MRKRVGLCRLKLSLHTRKRTSRKQMAVVGTAKENRLTAAVKAVLSMNKVLMILESIFGCWHRQLSRPFTLSGWTYEVCLSCGKKFAYDRAKICSGVAGPQNLALLEDLNEFSGDFGSLAKTSLLKPPVRLT